MSTVAEKEVITLYDSLKSSFTKQDWKAFATTLDKVKIALTQVNYLTPETKNEKMLILTREILEMSCYYSIKVKDILGFSRYFTQLEAYYGDFSKLLPTSERMFPLLGINLLHLLSQNKISAFHTKIEMFTVDQLSNIYIRHPITVEQCLMEGSYGKIWNSRVNVPAEEYLFFMDILMETIREEIASCSEKAYTSLPLADAATLIYFKSPEEVLEFAKKRGWSVNAAEKKIYFAESVGGDKTDLMAHTLVKQNLSYARELERIV